MAGSGLCAGFLDVKFGDLLLTALFVLAATMLLGALRPQRPWRWTLLVAVFVPLVQLIAYAAADRETLSRANLRIVSRVPDRNCRCVRWSDCEKRIGGIVEVRVAASSCQLSASLRSCHPERSLLFAQSAKSNQSKDPYVNRARAALVFAAAYEKREDCTPVKLEGSFDSA